MKGVKAPDYIREFRAVAGGTGWDIKFFSELMGYQNIGLRLAKNGDLPKFGRKADNEGDARLLCNEWNRWLRTESIHSSGSRKKRSSSRK